MTFRVILRKDVIYKNNTSPYVCCFSMMGVKIGRFGCVSTP